MANLFKRIFGIKETRRPRRERVEKAKNSWSTFVANDMREAGSFSLSKTLAKTFQREADLPISIPGHTTDAALDGVPLRAAQDAMTGNKLNFVWGSTMPDVLISWYASQGFIGYQLAATLAQNWLISKCCLMPAQDAIRNGYDISINNGVKVDEKIIDAIRQADAKYGLNHNLIQLAHLGRVFGQRIALFVVKSKDPEYYFKPFNPDGIEPGSYKGISQIDPYWMAPELDNDATGNPASPNFYEPTWWRINGVRIHRTHLVIFRTEEVPDILKPTYFYGGIPIPQKIYERVYNAERTANEAPMLALTKRTDVLKMDLSAAASKEMNFQQRMQEWVFNRNNYGVKVIGHEDDMLQFDTSLAELDAAIMTQYQLVAAAANIPATKLLGTAPKGFNATGEFDEASYHEELKTLQANKLTPLIDRHHLLLIRSEIAPQFKIEPFETSVVWNSLDEMTAKEVGDLNKLKADTGQVLMASGAIDGQDERKRVINDPESGYNGLEEEEAPLENEEGEDSDAETSDTNES